MIEKIEGIDENGFIRVYKIKEELCDSIVDVFNKAPDKFKKPGEIRTDSGIATAEDIKKSTDLVLLPDKEVDSPVIGTYFKLIQHCFEDYMREFSILNSNIPVGLKEPVTIQHYKPSEGYYQWHFERHISEPASHRVAVFMTYLNDVENGGTDFLYQKMTTRASKGITIIWPADWTHTHKGEINKEYEKYIITGWISWCPKPLEEKNKNGNET